MSDTRMRILVTGSRQWHDRALIMRTLAAFRAARPTIVHGAAPGADTWADECAIVLDYDREPHPIPEEWWQRYGNAAGPLRNKAMLDAERPDLVIAFRMPGVSKGTDDMIRRAVAARIPVWVVRCHGLDDGDRPDEGR